mmetsp:Transcript_14166/g.21390  ORF Transcript_14166/g.21390 Transcript_14166/m.21390 type:complete len:103 (-) Transcript_14166:19-327(-)
MGYVTHSNTYASEYKYQHIPPPSPGKPIRAALPGIFFVYKINPYMLQINECRPSFATFLVNLCAQFGGIFAISSLLDSITFQLFWKKAKEIISHNMSNLPNV